MSSRLVSLCWWLDFLSDFFSEEGAFCFLRGFPVLRFGRLFVFSVNFASFIKKLTRRQLFNL